MSVHRLEAVAATPPPASAHVKISQQAAAARHSRPRMNGSPPIAAVDVYVDDFLLLAQTANQGTCFCHKDAARRRLLVNA